MSAAAIPNASAGRMATRPAVAQSSPARRMVAPCQPPLGWVRDAPTVLRRTAAIHGAVRIPKPRMRRRADRGLDAANAVPATQTTPISSSQAAKGHGWLVISAPWEAVSRCAPVLSRASTLGHAWGSSRSAGTPAASTAAGNHRASSAPP